jgi:Domain of unknown function (DUF4411)
MITRYSVDTSALIQPWRDVYPPRRFKGFWQRYTSLFDSGQAVAVDEVLRELRKKDGDDLLAWVKERPSAMFVALEPDIQRATTQALDLCRRMVGSHKGYNVADPFVIGLAIARELTVVTFETPSGGLKRPRIPDVCKELHVPCVDMIGLLDAEDWEV